MRAGRTTADTMVGGVITVGDMSVGNISVGNISVRDATVQSIGAIGNGTTANDGEFTDAMEDAQSIGNDAMEDTTTKGTIATGINLPAATNLDLSPTGDNLPVAVYGGGPFDNLPVVGGSVSDPDGTKQVSLLRMPPGRAIEIGAIDKDEPGKSDDWSLTSAAKWKARKTSTSGEELMIQAMTDETLYRHWGGRKRLPS